MPLNSSRIAIPLDDGDGRVRTDDPRTTLTLMRMTLDPFRLLLISLAGYLNKQQQEVIDYLQEENRVLREQLGSGGCP